MSAQTARDVALDHFARGFNCAEATALGLIQAFDLEGGCVPRIATGFGGGVGGCGEVCGALVGAVMALGLKHGRIRPDDVEAKNALGVRVRELVAAFEKEFGSVRCIDLTNCDMRTPEGMAEAKARKLHTDFCPKFVAFAAEQAAEILAE